MDQLKISIQYTYINRQQIVEKAFFCLKLKTVTFDVKIIYKYYYRMPRMHYKINTLRFLTIRAGIEPFGAHKL